MRPVDKGKEPDEKYRKYQDAEILLEKRIGAYCSFCELPLVHVPEVEHKEAKALGGDLLAWKNLLLSCKYCNTRKGERVAAGCGKLYLWADEDDTFHAYTYEMGIPKLNEKVLREKGDDFGQRAANLFKLVKLDNFPNPKEKDRRWNKRIEAYNTAEESLEGWKNIQNKADKELFLNQTLHLAKATGFFSVWMEVFKEYKEVQKRLIAEFEGTQKAYFVDIFT